MGAYFLDIVRKPGGKRDTRFGENGQGVRMYRLYHYEKNTEEEDEEERTKTRTISNLRVSTGTSMSVYRR